MSDPYERAKGGRLIFKGGSLATCKSIDKKKKKNKHKRNKKEDDNESDQPNTVAADDEAENGAAGQVYTIDAAKNMKYDELFPVEAKKFGYDPKSSAVAKPKTLEEALDDRVKKKADRYCK